MLERGIAIRENGEKVARLGRSIGGDAAVRHHRQVARFAGLVINHREMRVGTIGELRGVKNRVEKRLARGGVVAASASAASAGIGLRLALVAAGTVQYALQVRHKSGYFSRKPSISW